VFIGTTLRIEMREEVANFYPDELNRWKNPAWWEKEHWKKMLPESEWHRVDKFRNQAAKSGVVAPGKKKPGGLEGYHFVEMKEMRALEARGMKWLYENYWLFDAPGEKAAVFRPGYELLLRTFGEAKMAELHEISRRYRRPVKDGSLPVPDLFVYREEGDRLVDCHFREVKRNDKVSDAQLLSMALIESVLELPVNLIRYVPDGSEPPSTVYRREFQPLGTKEKEPELEPAE
jgi:hypothetical protein